MVPDVASTADKIEIELDVKERNAAERLASVSDSMKRIGAASQQSANQMVRLDSAFKNTSAQTAAMGSVVGQLGSQLTSLDPKLAGVVSRLGAAGGAVSSFSSVLTGGGISGALAGAGAAAVGGAIGAIGLFATAQGEAALKAERLRDELEKQKETVESLASSYVKLGQSQTEAEANAAQRLATGVGGTRAVRYDRLTGQSYETGIGNVVSASERRRLQVLADLRRRQADAQRSEADNAAALAEINRIEGAAFDGSSGAKQSTARSNPERERLLARIEAEQDASKERLRLGEEAIKQEQALQEQAHQIGMEMQERERRARAEAFTERMDQMRELYDEQERTFEREERLAQQRAQLWHASSESAKAYGEQATEAVVRVAIGEGDAAQMILAGIGNQMVAEGSRYVFRGGLELLSGNPAGGAMAALGLAEIAAGAALGATVQSSAPGAGGGGGAGPAEPRRTTRVGASSEPTTNTYNIYMNTLTPSADAGEAIARSLEERHRQTGRGVGV